MANNRAAERARKVEMALAHMDLAMALLEDVCGWGALSPSDTVAVLDRLSSLADVVDPDDPLDQPDEAVRPGLVH
jgi:hypothetical protein